MIGCVYAAVFAVLWSPASVLPEGSTVAASIWGFHFIVGSLLAIALRRVVARRRLPVPLHDGLLGRIAATAVDFTTAAALSAIELDTLGDVIVPILPMTSCGGVLTLVLSLWLGRRAFPEAAFPHALLLYGTCTGTVPTGLALLRIVDPELRGPVAKSTIIAVTAGVPIGLPLFLGIIPVVVARRSAGFWPSVGLGAALLVGYTAVLVWIWVRVGPLRLLRLLTSLLPALRQDHSVQIGAATIRSPNP